MKIESPSTRSLEEQIAALLRETARAHHQAFLATDGVDPEWPQWYAAHLQEPLGALLASKLDAQRLAAELAALDVEQRREAPAADWAVHYAGRLVQTYARP